MRTRRLGQRKEIIISNCLIVNGVPKEFSQPVFRQHLRIPSSQVKDTEVPSKTQNATLHPLAEADAVTHAPFPFLNGRLKVSLGHCSFLICLQISTEEDLNVQFFKLLHPVVC